MVLNYKFVTLFTRLVFAINIKRCIALSHEEKIDLMGSLNWDYLDTHEDKPGVNRRA